MKEYKFPPTYWEYRQVSRNGVIAIHEVYFDNKDVPFSLTEARFTPYYVKANDRDSLKTLRTELEKMLEACDKPILEYNEIIFG